MESIVTAIECKYCVLLSNSCEFEVFPLLRHEYGTKTMCEVSPLHGRSFIVGKTSLDRYIVSKGNGLSYTQCALLHTGEFGNDTLGLLLRQDAIRDFTVGKEIEALGIKTNHMHCVIELDYPISLPNSSKAIKPILLQYDVECPYRIEDAPFMTREQITEEVQKWQSMNKNGRTMSYLIAADVLLTNLRILHDHGILHNALTTHNHTWALELLDFEIAHSPSFPYTREDDQRHVKDLFSREIIDVYRIILYIAGVLREPVDYAVLDELFNNYGFDLSKYSVQNVVVTSRK